MTDRGVESWPWRWWMLQQGTAYAPIDTGTTAGARLMSFLACQLLLRLGCDVVPRIRQPWRWCDQPQPYLLRTTSPVVLRPITEDEADAIIRGIRRETA